MALHSELDDVWERGHLVSEYTEGIRARTEEVTWPQRSRPILLVFDTRQWDFLLGVEEYTQTAADGGQRMHTSSALDPTQPAAMGALCESLFRKPSARPYEAHRPPSCQHTFQRSGRFRLVFDATESAVADDRVWMH